VSRGAWVSIALAGIGAACGGGGGTSGSGQNASREPGVLGVETSVATVAPFPHVVSAIGTVTPRPDRFAALAPPGQTRVARIFVVAGQRVAEGDALVEFERAPFDAAAQSAAAVLANAERAYERAVRLVQAGVLAQKDSGQAAADLAAAQAAAVTARRAQQLATLRAPLSGVVTRMSAVLGASVDANQTMVEVADPRSLDIVFNVSPTEAGRIHDGDTVTVTSGEGFEGGGGGGGEALGPGVVTSIGAAVDSASRAVAVRARLAQPTRALRIGESVFGRIITGVNPRAVVIPVEALVPEGDGYRVFVVDSAGIAHARAVTVGGRTESRVEILSGVAAGETVVTTGAYGVQDSARIGGARR
jgi:RND family efflux transporter MFP subunit